MSHKYHWTRKDFYVITSFSILLLVGFGLIVAGLVE